MSNNTSTSNGRLFNGFGLEIPFIEHLGVEMVKMKDGESHIEFEARSEHCNSFEMTHGGVVMTLLDVSMATASRSHQPEVGVVTIEMKTSFMRPARGRLTTLGRLIHRTGSMAFAEATVSDAQGQICAHATGTFKFVKSTLST